MFLGIFNKKEAQRPYAFRGRNTQGFGAKLQQKSVRRSRSAGSNRLVVFTHRRFRANDCINLFKNRTHFRI